MESVQAFAKFQRPDGIRSNHRELKFLNFSGPRPQKVCHTFCAPFPNRRTSSQYHPLQGLTVRKRLRTKNSCEIFRNHAKRRIKIKEK